MKRLRLIALLAAVAMVGSVFVGCKDKTNDEKPSSNSSSQLSQGGEVTAKGEVEVMFWTAPESYNYDLWNSYAEKFNETGAQVNGKKINVKVQQMPAQPSSEAGIQNAIATGTVPVLSENINRSFAGVLAESGVVYDIKGESWFDEIVAERKMEDVMDGWEVDSSQYVIPLYVNPIGYYWNSHALKALGATKVPETVEEYETLLNDYIEKKDGLAADGITHFMYRNEFTRTDYWWERWFDFEAQYNAFAGGTPLVDGENLTMDEDAVKKTLELYGKAGSSLLLGEISQIWSQDTVPVVMGLGLPWDVTANRAAGKTYGLDGDYVFGPMIVEKKGDTPYTFADSKGIVFYKHSSISDEQHEAGIEFVKYVFTGDAKETFDIDWLQETGMLPVRGDLLTNDTLSGYFDENVELKDIASFVANGIPCMSNPNMETMFTAMAEEGLTPYFNNEVVNAEPGTAPDATKAVENIKNAMKDSGELK